jgi:AcrR family transcriptional regulator
MRAIAQEAGVSTGNAYYYFSSKDELIQEFYLRNHAEHAAACRSMLEAEHEFASRLRGTLTALIQVLDPYHSFAASFYKHAAEPASPLSPFSAESSAARDASIALFREVAAGSSARLDPELRAELPELLWLLSLGIVLFWVHDTSPQRAKTYRLIDATVSLADRLLSLARLPMMRRTMRQVVGIIQEIRS